MNIVAKYLKLPSGITVKKYYRNKTVPMVTIKSKKTSAIKPTQTAQSSSSMGIERNETVQVLGADILAEQNRTIINSGTTTKLASKNNNEIITVVNRDEYNRLATGINGTNTIENVNRLKTLFEQDTGLILHCPANRTNLFGIALSQISRDIKLGIYPKDIKHVLIGHGIGSSIPNKSGYISWELEGLSFANGKHVNIFEYINKNIPKGEKVLVCSCEEGVAISGRPCVGKHVELSLGVPTEPAKIVQSGENKIIGHYTSYDPKFPNSGAVYYSTNS